MSLEETLQRVASEQRRMAEVMKPAADRINKALAPLLSWSTEFQQRIDAHLKLQGPVLARLAEIGKRANLLDQSGWLPHYTTPFDLIDQCEDDPSLLAGGLSQFYQDSWNEVRRTIEEKVTCYDVDDEAKGTFFEALACHEAGYYRSVVRLLFPEVERIARVELHQDKVESVVTSQKDLRKLASSFTPAELEPKGLYSFRLYKCLNNHLYSYLSDEVSRDQLRESDIPNRHACLHGHVIYRTSKHSLNMIFMADYLYQVISSAKELGLEVCEK